MSDIPQRAQGTEFEHADKLKEKMPEFIQWRQKQVDKLDDDFKDKAEEIAKKARREGFWMNADSIFDLHIVHNLDLEKIENDIMDAVGRAFDEDEEE